MGVEAMYEGWRRIQDRLVARLPGMSAEQLSLTAVAESWPVWAIVSHIAGTRVYWLCSVCGEPGIESTPFRDLGDEGWEDRLDVPRGSRELLEAVRSSWAVVDSCLTRWTPEMLDVAFTRTRDGEVQKHTRYSVLTRLVMHDSFHAGEVSLLLGLNRSPSLDPWETAAV
jgi:uncharacterized damage-inducible protein DinB